MRANKEILMRKVAGETILIPTGTAAMKIKGLASLSESGALVWRLLNEGDQTDQTLTAAICKEYDIDETTATADVQTLLQSMKQLGFLEE